VLCFYVGLLFLLYSPSDKRACTLAHFTQVSLAPTLCSPTASSPRWVCWSRRAYRVQRGKGPASALVRLRPRHCPQAQPEASAGSSLDAVNLTRWSLCFRRQTHTWRVGVVITEDDPSATSTVQRRTFLSPATDGSAGRGRPAAHAVGLWPADAGLR
jgi:hypothetical protein